MSKAISSYIAHYLYTFTFSAIFTYNCFISLSKLFCITNGGFIADESQLKLSWGQMEVTSDTRLAFSSLMKRFCIHFIIKGGFIGARIKQTLLWQRNETWSLIGMTTIVWMIRNSDNWDLASVVGLHLGIG